MKNKKGAILGLAALFLVTACSQETKEEIAVQEERDKTPEVLIPPTTAPDTEKGFSDGHTAENALSYAGIYKAVLPCADCPGIETTLELDYRGNYVLTENYIDRDSTFVDQGSFTWNKKGDLITLKTEDGVRRYFVGENVLYPTDENGKIIESSSGLDYSLKQVQSSTNTP